MDQVAADGPSAAFGNISAGRDLTIIINPLPAIRNVTDHLPTIGSTSLDVSDKLVGRLDDLKETSSNVESYARKLQGILPHNHPELQEALRKHASILSDVEILEDSLRKYISDKGSDDRLFFTQGIYDDIIDIRTRLLSLHLELNTIHTSNKSIDPALIREIMVQCQQSYHGQPSDHEGSGDDISSYYTFYSASSIPYIERQKWKEIEKAIRRRLGAEVVRDNYASVIAAVENVLSLDGAITPLSNQHSARNLSEIGARRYFAVPFSLSAQVFWGREEELRNIGNLLSYSDEDPKFKCIVLSGMGGMGKTATALQYAKTQIQAFNVIFWVRSENRQSIQQSFSVIASELNLETAHHGSIQKEDSTSFVLSWLSQTELSWLLVFDNVEDDDGVICDYWPKETAKGRILITTRRKRVLPQNGHREIIINPWPNDVAAQFLLRNLHHRSENDSKLDDHRYWALQVSAQLVCTPFVLTQILKYITDTQSTIREFGEALTRAAGMTKTHPNDVPSIPYTISEALSHCYALLDSSTAIILGLLCFLDPNILISIFERSDGLETPMVLETLRVNSYEWKSSLEKLIQLSLVQWTQKNVSIQVDHLVVATFKARMGNSERQQRLSDAIELVAFVMSEVDPQSDLLGFYAAVDCVPFLRRCFYEERRANISYTPPESYFEVNYFAQKYFEFFSHEDKRCVELLETNRIVNELLPKNPEAERRQALIDLEYGQLCAYKGKFSEGISLLDRSREFFSKQNSPSPPEAGWASRNLANALASMGLFDRALQEQGKILSFYKDMKRDKLIIEMMIDIGVVHLWAGHFDQARNQIEEALIRLKSATPESFFLSEPLDNRFKISRRRSYGNRNIEDYAKDQLNGFDIEITNMNARCHLALFTLSLKKLETLKDYGPSRTWSVSALRSRALQIEHLEKAELHSKLARMNVRAFHQFHATFYYRQGCLNLELGQFERSINEFREAFNRTRRTDAFRIAEARCCFMLSKALSKDKSNPKNKQEAAEFRSKAEMLLKQHDPSAENFDDIKSYDSRIYILWR